MTTIPSVAADRTGLAAARRLARLRSPAGRIRLIDIASIRRDAASDRPVTAVRGAPAGIAALLEPVDPRLGLVLRFDDPDVHDRGDGRRQRTARGWAVADIDRLGADAIWLTVWWHPEAVRAVRHGQEKFVEIVGHDAAHHQLPLIVAPAVDVRPTAGDSTPERELAIERHVVGRFADPRFGADVIAVPCPPRRVVAEASIDHLRQHFVQIDQLVAGRWILSADDVPADTFAEVADVADDLGSIGGAGPST